jgi:hypothetical protein
VNNFFFIWFHHFIILFELKNFPGACFKYSSKPFRNNEGLFFLKKG